MKLKHEIDFDGRTIVRNSETHQYSHAVFFKYVNPDEMGAWEREHGGNHWRLAGWCSRLDLAESLAKQWQGGRRVVTPRKQYGLKKSWVEDIPLKETIIVPVTRVTDVTPKRREKK